MKTYSKELEYLSFYGDEVITYYTKDSYRIIYKNKDSKIRITYNFGFLTAFESHLEALIHRYKLKLK